FNAEFQKFASYEEQHEASGHSDDDNHAVIVIPQSGRLQQVADLYGSDTGTRVTILTPQGGV
ncbi:MAG: hypothetical protein KDH08_19980, partial [Anaerolineae bacterium]|nr:hypothetical protein [Anaerolineae bacterium]